MQPKEKLSIGNLLAYGMGDIYGGGAFIIIGTLFLFFLTKYAGIPPILAGLVFGIGKVWDAVSDPLMGYLSDRTRSRFGRRRIYFIIGIIPIAVSFFLLWLPIDAAVGWKFVYYAFAYIFLSTVFTLVMVPYSALNADMTDDYKERTRLSGFRMFFSQVSALVASVVPKMIIDRTESVSLGYLTMGLIFGIVYAVPWIIVFFGTKEKVAERPKKAEGFLYIFKNFGTLFKNRTCRVHILMYIAAYTAMDILMAVFLFYLSYFLGRDSWYTPAMGSLFVTLILFLPFYVWLSNKKGKGVAYRVGLCLWLAGMLLSSLLGPETPLWGLLGVCVLIGSGLSAGVMVPWAILPSATDVDHIITGKKRAGLYSGAITLIRKMAQGLIAMPMVGVVLQLIGFQADQVQSEATLNALKVFYILGPILFIAAGIIISTRFKLTPETHGVLKAEIDRLEAGGSKEEVEEETRKVVEQLTGREYREVFGG